MKKSIAVSLILFAAACASPSEEPDTSGAVTALGIRNTKVVAPDLVSAGQPDEAQLRKLAELGYTNMINLRPDSEPGTGFEEALATELGVRFTRIPVDGAAGVTVENARRLADALATDGKAFVSCASGNRVGALLALKARFIDGKTAEEALEIGKAGGMTRLEPKVKEMLGKD